MFIDLLKMREEERTGLYLQSTYFNIHFNRTRKYRSVFTALSALSHKKDNELWCVITNTARAIKHGAKGMQIPRSYPAYNNNVQRIVHGNMCVLLDQMEANGYLCYYRGGLVGMSKENKLPSIYTFTNKYLSLWEGVDVSKEKSDNPLLQVRDRITKENLSLNRRTGVAEIKHLVQAYNVLLENTEISVKGVVLPTQQYKRVFTEDLLRGGRWYNLSGCIQTMPKKDRPFITINGEPTVELDYKALHPSILYDKIEKETGMCIDVGDPYGVSLEGVFNVVVQKEQHSPARNLVKQVLLKALNAKDAKAAYGTITQDWYEEYKKGEEGAFYGLSVSQGTGAFPVKDLCDRVMQAHSPIKHAFFSDVGLLLQRTDSDIMGLVLKRFTEIGVCALGWHDSVVVPEKYEQMAKAQMLSAYKEIVGSDNHCFVERK